MIKDRWVFFIIEENLIIMPTFFKRNKSEDQQDAQQNGSMEEAMPSPTKDFFISLGIIVAVIVLMTGLILAGRWAWNRYVSDDAVVQEQTEAPAAEDKGIAEPVAPNEEAQTDETASTVAVDDIEQSTDTKGVEVPDETTDTSFVDPENLASVLGVTLLVAAFATGIHRLAYSVRHQMRQ